MRKFLSSVTFKILIGIFAFLIGLMVYSGVNGDKTSILEKALTVITTPFQSAFSSIGHSVSEFWHNFTSPGRIANENAALKDELAALREQMVDFENYKNQNEIYKEQLKIQEENPTLTLLASEVIGRDTDDYGTSFIINRGTSDGVSVRDTVITKNGMVGVVTEVYPTSSRVTTVLSTDLQIGARILRTRDTGVMRGVTSWALNSTAKLSYVSLNSGISVGDIVVTSGVSGMYPEDLILGTIKEIKTEEGGVSLYAVVSAVEDITAIRNVYVITDVKTQSDGE